LLYNINFLTNCQSGKSNNRNIHDNKEKQLIPAPTQTRHFPLSTF
jgi:hypothetical protein